MKYFPPRISSVFLSKSGEDQKKKRSSLKFSPVFGPKLDEDKKKKVFTQI